MGMSGFFPPNMPQNTGLLNEGIASLNWKSETSKRKPLWEDSGSVPPNLTEVSMGYQCLALPLI